LKREDLIQELRFGGSVDTDYLAKPTFLLSIKNFNSPPLCAAKLSLLLSGCGAGDGSGTDGANVGNAAASAINKAGGSPVVTPGSGGATAQEGIPISGPSTNPFNPSTGTETPFVKDPLVEALATGNSSVVTARKVIAAMRVEATRFSRTT
jgi:hypothetical protein